MQRFFGIFSTCTISSSHRLSIMNVYLLSTCDTHNYITIGTITRSIKKSMRCTQFLLLDTDCPINTPVTPSQSLNIPAIHPHSYISTLAHKPPTHTIPKVINTPDTHKLSKKHLPASSNEHSISTNYCIL